MPAQRPQPMLRRQNRIRTIQGSLAIEGNTLSVEQVSDIIDQKRVLGPPREILEVKNAIRAYDSLPTFQPYSTSSLRKAHLALMQGLTPDAGRWRAGGVGIWKGTKVTHVAPPASKVPELVTTLFESLAADRETHLLVQGAVVHYELEFIHPFTDGNGRLGRLWQGVLLHHFSPLFDYVPIESMVKDRQRKYYRALEESDRQADARLFIEFSLGTIKDSLEEFSGEFRAERLLAKDRIQLAQEHFGTQEFRRKEYMALFQALSTATGSRDLAWGIGEGLLTSKGEKALTKYRFRK